MSFNKARRNTRYSIWLAALVLLLFVAGLNTTAFAQTVILDAISGHATAGQIARVPVEIIVNAGAQPTRVILEGTYDSAYIALEAVVTGPAASSAKKAAHLTLNEPGHFRVEVIGDCVNGCTNLIGSGTLIYLDFRTNPLFVAKILPITLTLNQVFDSQNHSIPSSVRDGLVIINDGFAPLYDLYIAQMASGIQSPDFGGYETYVVLTNPLETTTGVLVEFIGEDGQPLNTMIGGNYDSTFYVELTGNATLTMETHNSQAIQKGWMRIRSGEPVGGNVIYSYINATGEVISQTGILPSTPMRSFVCTVDTRTDRIIGLAVANPNISRVCLTLVLRDLSGAVKGQTTLAIDPMGKLAMVLEELFPNADLRNFLGAVSVSTTGQDVVATTLRFSPDLQIFTSQQVVPR